MNIESTARRRILIWSHEQCPQLLSELSALNYDVVAVVQSSVDGAEYFSLHDLYFGDARLTSWPVVENYTNLTSSEFRQYVGCIARLGFVPNSTSYFSYFGGPMAPSDMEDWGQWHKQLACRLLQKLAIDEVWFFAPPHLGLDNVMEWAARDLGLTVLSARQLPFPAKFSCTLSRAGALQSIAPVVSARPWQDGATAPQMFYMAPDKSRSAKQWFIHILGMFGRPSGDIWARMYTAASRRKLWWLISALDLLGKNTRPTWLFRRAQRQRWRQDALNRRLVDPISISAPYIYFPLHYEPEANVAVHGGAFKNQAMALESLSLRLPSNWKILIKENPQQLFMCRGQAFHARIAALKNVYFVPDDTSTVLLLERSALVATISGTVGYESLRLGRSVLYFGDPWYASLPGALDFTAFAESIESAAQQSVARSDLDASVNHLVSHAFDGVVAPRFCALLGRDAIWSDWASITAKSLVEISRSVDGESSKNE